MKFRKKPVVIEAQQFFHNRRDTWHAAVCINSGKAECDSRPHIHTLEGAMLIGDRDWIITGVHGEHYPCKPDIFEKTYERAE